MAPLGPPPWGRGSLEGWRVVVRGLPGGAEVAQRVGGAEVAGTVGGMVQVPFGSRLDDGAAAGTGHDAGIDALGPSLPFGVMLLAVAALLPRPALHIML